MSCPSCGHENREDARFCGQCAAPLTADPTCPSCGCSNPLGQRFCDGCARPLTAVEAIETGRRRKTPIWEARAHLTLARVLLSRTGGKVRGEIESALASCLSLVEQTQARVYEPPVHEVRAGLADLHGDEATRERELVEAHRLYTEMGATGHAERVARELDAL